MHRKSVRIGLVLLLCTLVGLFAFDWQSRKRQRAIPLPVADQSRAVSPPAKEAEKPESASEAAMKLRKAVAGADLLVIEDQGMFGKPQPPFEIRSAEQVKQLFDLIDIDEDRSGRRCKCDGEFWIRVRRGREELALIGWHHNKALRWHEGPWHGDGALTEEARAAIPAWLKKNGFPQIQMAMDEEARRQKKEEDDRKQFASYFPESVRGPLLERWPHGFADKARAALDMVTLITCVCRALGSGTADGERHFAVVGSLYDATGEQFLAALQRMDKDNLGLAGATASASKST